MTQSSKSLWQILQEPIPRKYIRAGVIVFYLVLACAFVAEQVSGVWMKAAMKQDLVKGYRGMSESQLMLIGMAFRDYCTENNEWPDSIPSFYMAKSHECPSSFFISPRRTETTAVGPSTQAIADQLADGGHCSYVYLGRGLTKDNLAPNTIIMYELLTDSDPGTAVLYADGHTEYVDAATAAKIVSRANTGTFPVTRPSN
jgi:hypothetical protein